MPKKPKTKVKKVIINKQVFAFFVLILVLVLTILQVQHKQVFQEHAASQVITGCGDSGDPGNEDGVGKFCTAGGGQCVGTGSPICSADIQAGPGLCSKPCSTDADCGTGAVCLASSLGSGCEPVACEATPTPTTSATTPTPTIGSVPTPVCLGGGCPTPTIVSPTVSVVPTATTAPTAAPSSSGGGLSGLLQLLLQFIQLIIGFFASLI